MRKVASALLVVSLHISGACAADVPAKGAFVPAKITEYRSTGDYYPAQAKRLGQEGVVVVHLCVSARGKTEASIATSSGFPLLDEAAERSLTENKWQPATRDGTPADSCKDLKVTFNLGPKLRGELGEKASAPEDFTPPPATEAAPPEPARP